jgi:hypothetical protein
MATRRVFTREFKLEAVKLVSERGVSIAQGSVHLDDEQPFRRPACRDPRDLAPALALDDCGVVARTGLRTSNPSAQ